MVRVWGELESVVVHVVVEGVGRVLGGEFLGSNLLCGEKTATGASGTPHGMFMTRLVQIGLERGE